MFKSCSSLKYLNFSNFNTNKVTNMSYMFNECSSLKNLDLSSFHTLYVTDMECMFCDCISLEKLNLSNFISNYDKNNDTNMKFMFKNCLSLKNIDFPYFEIGGKKKYGIFFGCSNELRYNIKERKKNNGFEFCKIF